MRSIAAVIMFVVVSCSCGSMSKERKQAVARAEVQCALTAATQLAARRAHAEANGKRLGLADYVQVAVDEVLCAIAARNARPAAEGSGSRIDAGAS
jgi:hypothetical protein